MKEVVNEIDELAEEYKSLKGEKNFHVLTLCERVKTFLDIAKDSEYSTKGFEKVDEIQDLFFNNETFMKLGMENVENHFETFKVYDRIEKQAKYIVVINPDGFKKGVPFTSYKKLIMFNLSLKDHVISIAKPQEVRSCFLNGQYKLQKNGQKLEGVEDSVIEANNKETTTNDYISVQESFEIFISTSKTRNY